MRYTTCWRFIIICFLVLGEVHDGVRHGSVLQWSD